MQAFPILSTGRRKSAVAQVKLLEGNGQFVINGKKASEYLQDDALHVGTIEAPLKLLKLQQKYDVLVKVEGGGIVGQSEAIRLGLARALSAVISSARKSLKEKGYLTRDSRCKERRKYGLKKARKAPQFSKR